MCHSPLHHLAIQYCVIPETENDSREIYLLRYFVGDHFLGRIHNGEELVLSLRFGCNSHHSLRGLDAFLYGEKKSRLLYVHNISRVVLCLLVFEKGQ